MLRAAARNVFYTAVPKTVQIVENIVEYNQIKECLDTWEAIG